MVSQSLKHVNKTLQTGFIVINSSKRAHTFYREQTSPVVVVVAKRPTVQIA